MIYSTLDIFSEKVHNFIDTIRKKNISADRREKLYFIIMDLKERTETQKIRFLLYYDLMPNKNEKKLTLTDIGKMYNCSASAVRNSILRVVSSVSRVRDEEKQKQILDIIGNEEKNECWNNR